MWSQGLHRQHRAGPRRDRPQIVETLRGKAEWKPPQYGDQTEPNDFGPPLNVNGDFEQGPVGWEGPDGVSTFLIDGPPGAARC